MNHESVTHFPSLERLVDETTALLIQRERVPKSSVRCVVSPYRICPLGAHVDHQGGSVLGRTIDAYSVLAFVPAPEPTIRLHRVGSSTPTAFRLDTPAAIDLEHWGRYACAAAAAVGRTQPPRCGWVGAVGGTLPASGLSSSASVGLAYIHALAAANDIAVGPSDLVELDRQLENDFLGLENGILDPSTIVYGHAKALLHVNTRDRATDLVMDATDRYRFIVAYSGFSRELTSTGFNARVRECRDAARLLAQHANLDAVEILSDVTPEAYERHREQLPRALRRRADHYFSEVRRVESGRVAWSKGDLEQFGTLMNASCQSSIESYECGSPALKLLQRIVSSSPGVYGSRFSGGGYGGCVVGLVDPASAPELTKRVMNEYIDRVPEVAGRAQCYVTQPESGLRLQ